MRARAQHPPGFMHARARPASSRIHACARAPSQPARGHISRGGAARRRGRGAYVGQRWLLGGVER
eukprot:COSAG05_NODE_763_length_7481_cov_10.717150_6_plen_65_part_00